MQACDSIEGVGEIGTTPEANKLSQKAGEVVHRRREESISVPSEARTSDLRGIACLLVMFNYILCCVHDCVLRVIQVVSNLFATDLWLPVYVIDKTFFWLNFTSRPVQLCVKIIYLDFFITAAVAFLE